MVVRVDVEDPVIIPPIEEPITEEPTIVEPELPEWAKNAVNIEPNLLGKIDGELTVEDEGRDWYSFEAVAGEDYIIELVSALDLAGPGPEEPYSIQYVDNHLVDPSILEIVNAEGEQVLDEHDKGGFISLWARVYFMPEEAGAYYIAVGSGAQARGYTGLYTLTVRADDFVDDHHTVRDVTLRAGESITARIDSDVPHDHPGLNAWDWWVAADDQARPMRGLESLDDRDFFRFVIEEAGIYELSVTNAPKCVGIWATWGKNGDQRYHAEFDPVLSITDHYQPGAYFVEVGTPWQSAGNAGLYTLSLFQVED